MVFRRLAEVRVAGGAGRVRVVREVDFGSTRRDLVEWQRCEAVNRSSRPDDPSRGGMGLRLARRLCVHVDIARTGEGASVRLTTRLR